VEKRIFSKTPRDNFGQLSSNATIEMSSKYIVLLVVAFSISFFIGLPVNLIMLEIVVLVALIVFVVWYSYEYISKFVFTLNKQILFVRRGAIIYSYTMIPYKNIQDVHVVQSALDRIFGIWRVVVFTATSTTSGSEHIFGLEKKTAEEFKQTIFKRIKEVKNVTD